MRNYEKVWDASGLMPEKLGGQSNDQPKPRARTKKIVDDDDSNFVMKNQKFTIENEESHPQKHKSSKTEQEEDHEFYQQYTRKKIHGLNTRASDFDEP